MESFEKKILVDEDFVQMNHYLSNKYRILKDFSIVRLRFVEVDERIDNNETFDSLMLGFQSNSNSCTGC